MTYEQCWTEAANSYMSQPHHPIWFSKLIKGKIVPGYNHIDIIKKLNSTKNNKNLTSLF